MGSTYFTIMRGETVDDVGDISDVGIPIYQHVPVTIIERSQQNFDPASATRRTIRTIEAVFPSWADINDDDTLMDEMTTPPNFYMIEMIVSQPVLTNEPPKLLLTLRARSGIAVPTD